MPAQLIILDHDLLKPGSGTTKGKGTKPAKDPAPTPPSKAKPPSKWGELPPFHPFPVGHVAVFGQEPIHAGHFKTIWSLFGALQKDSKIAGDRSRTVFATVGSFKDLQSKATHQSLAKLPDELTIVVREAKSDV